MTNGSLRKFYGWFTVLGLLVGGLVVLGYYRDEYREWKDYQRKYIQEEIRRAATPQQRALAESMPVEIRQILLPGPQPRGPLHDLPSRGRRPELRRLPATARLPSAARTAPLREIRLHRLPSRPGPRHDRCRRARQRAALGRADAAAEIHPGLLRQMSPGRGQSRPRPNWPAASRCSRTAAAAAATSSAASAA